MEYKIYSRNKEEKKPKQTARVCVLGLGLMMSTRKRQTRHHGEPNCIRGQTTGRKMRFRPLRLHPLGP